MRIGVCGNGERGQYRWEGGEMWDCGSGIPKGVLADRLVGSRGSNGVDSLLREGPGGCARSFGVMVSPGARLSVCVGDVCPRT